MSAVKVSAFVFLGCAQYFIHRLPKGIDSKGIYSPDLAPSDFYPFADLKRMLPRKRFGSNEKNKSFCKKGIESLMKRWNECIILEGDYIDE